MLRFFAVILAPIIYLGSFSIAYASPWFTGPIFARSGKTLPLGKIRIKPYAFLSTVNASYNSLGKKTPRSEFKTSIYLTKITYGLSDWTDVQLTLPYVMNKSENFQGKHLGDVAILLGFQAMNQNSSSWRPDLRLTIQELIPTGRFDQLDPTANDVGVTGAGSYQSIFALNFQELTSVGKEHYLRTRCQLSYLYGFPFDFHNRLQDNTEELITTKISPHSAISVDVAAELTLTQHWVAVMETFWISHQASTFNRNISFAERGVLSRIGPPAFRETSLAPAIEYNFSKNIGILAGVWFAVQGRNAPVFRTTAIAINVSL